MNAATEPSAPSARRRRAAIGCAWLLGGGALLLVRQRARWPAWIALHRWLADLGVPDWLRGLDGLVLHLLAAWLGARLAGACLHCPWWHAIGLRGGRHGWPAAVGLAALPMLGGGLVLGARRGGFAVGIDLGDLLGGVVRAPLVEELLCRGLLVGVVVAAGARSAATRASVAASALLFASLHVPWTAAGFAAGWPTILVTAAGGVWFAWLLLRWRTLWVPIGLHGAMNLGWMLARVEGGAGGGGAAENLLRAATIAIATLLTIRRSRG